MNKCINEWKDKCIGEWMNEFINEWILNECIGYSSWLSPGSPWMISSQSWWTLSELSQI